MEKVTTRLGRRFSARVSTETREDDQFYDVNEQASFSCLFPKYLSSRKKPQQYDGLV